MSSSLSVAIVIFCKIYQLKDIKLISQKVNFCDFYMNPPETLAKHWQHCLGGGGGVRSAEKNSAKSF
jgi:hypothetical protein